MKTSVFIMFIPELWNRPSFLSLKTKINSKPKYNASCHFEAYLWWSIAQPEVNKNASTFKLLGLGGVDAIL